MHTNISPDDLSSLSHEILQILPRGLDGKLISALCGERGRRLTLPTNKFLLGGATPFWPRKFRASPVAIPIFPGMGGAPNRAVSSRSWADQYHSGLRSRCFTSRMKTGRPRSCLSASSTLALLASSSLANSTILVVSMGKVASKFDLPATFRLTKGCNQDFGENNLSTYSIRQPCSMPCSSTEPPGQLAS